MIGGPAVEYAGPLVGNCWPSSITDILYACCAELGKENRKRRVLLDIS